MGVCLSRCGNHNWEPAESKKRMMSETTTYAPSPYDPNHSFKMFLQAQSRNSPSTNSLPRSSELFSLPASELHEQHRSPSDATSSRASISSKKRIQPEQPGHQRLLEAIARLERLDDRKPVNCALGIGGICSSDDIVAVPGKPRRNRRVRHYQLPLPKENPVQDFLRSIEGFVSLIDEPRKPEPNRVNEPREPKIVSRVDDGAVGEETFASEFEALAGLRQDQNQKLQAPMLPQSGPRKIDMKCPDAAVTADCEGPSSIVALDRSVPSSRVHGEETFAFDFKASSGLRQDRNQKLRGLPQSGPRKIGMKCPDVAGTGDSKGSFRIVALDRCVPSDDAAVGEETFTLDFKALKHQKFQAPTRKSMSLQQLLQSAPQSNVLNSPDADCKRQSGAAGRAPEAPVKIGQDESIVASLGAKNAVARKNCKSTRSSLRGRGGLKQERSSRSLDSLQSFDIHVTWEFDNKGDDFATPSGITPLASKHLKEASPPIEVKKMELESLLISPTWSSNTSTVAVVENRPPKDVEAPLGEDALECTELGPAAAIVSSKSSDNEQKILLNSERFGLLEAFQSLLKLLLFNTEEDPDEENQYGIHPRE